MTLGEWLDARVPPPPASLRARLASELGSGMTREVAEGPGVLLAAGKRLLERVVTAQPQVRSQALDLLAADALVTYAFEAASELGQPLPALATDAMRELTSLSAAR